jgi:hypothetical protein
LAGQQKTTGLTALHGNDANPRSPLLASAACVLQHTPRFGA